MLYKNLSIIILAAGNNSRMLSDIPKVMHKIAGKYILQYLIDSVSMIKAQAIYIVHSSRYKKIKSMFYLSNKTISTPIHWVLQDVPLGTGHAVQTVLPMISDDSEVLILYGDVPFVSNKTFKRLIAIKSKCDICLLIANVVNPSGYGRIIRNNQGNIVKVLEHNDIIEDCDKDILEINSGVFISTVSYLKIWVNKLIPRNINGELYLTDIIDICYKSGGVIYSIYPIDTFEIIGINNKLDLIHAERAFQKKQVQNLLLSGVIISDPNRFDLRGTLEHGKDVYIDVNVIIEGFVSLGNRVQIGSGCILKNVIIEDDVIIYPFSIVENSKIKFKSKVGPFARLRPGTKLQEKTYVGNFVELKNTTLGTHSKVGHLSYLGDTEVGKKVNIGAGTVVCNYDGTKKYRTVIEDDVFIGSDSQLIAPIIVGKYATIGAGTTLTQNVAEGETVISRIRQFSILKKRLLQNINKT